MGFLGADEQPKARITKKLREAPSLETLHKAECIMCPLGANGHNVAFYNQLRHPHMLPYGAEEPLVYMLGEAPGEKEDSKGRPFIGPAGNVLRLRLPDWADDKLLRWSNVVRTRPPGNRTPEFEEMECCRPSVEKDIERTKPKAIFGFGNVPLKWATGEAGITVWTGRYFPIKVRSHTCWFFPIVHPSAILHTGGHFTPRDKDEFRSDLEFGFARDVERAFDLVDVLPTPVVHTIEEATADLELVTGHEPGDLDRVLDMLRHCWNKKVVGFDYETQGKRPYSKGAKILSLGLSSDQRSMAFAIDHHEAGWSAKERDKLLDALEDFLYDAKCRKVAHALGFELEWTAFFFGKAMVRAGLWGDSLTQAYVLDERQGGLSLDFLCRLYFGLNIKGISALNRKDLDSEPLDAVLKYNAIDGRYHRHVYNVQSELLLDDGTHEVYREHLRRVPTMVLTQLKGIPIDQPTVQGFYKEWKKKREAVEERIRALPAAAKFKAKYDAEFRPSATSDVKKVLEVLGLKNEKGNADEETLKEIKNPIAQAVLDWREANKILSTYVLPVLDIAQMDLSKEEAKELKDAGNALHPDGLMHPITTTHKTRTSRTASEETNYQNWPKREHKEIRTCVKVRRHWKLCSFDYGQIQARNVAMESKDRALVKAFWDRYDIHHDWTERVLKLDPHWMDDKGGAEAARKDKSIWKYYRDRTKNEFVFPSFFGAQPPKLSLGLGIPQKLTEKLARQFWAMFPSVKGWQEQLTENYLRDGYTTSLAGHRRHAPVSVNELINAPIQADEAEIVCNAMARLSELGKDRFQANMEIHDDLTFIWPADDVEDNSLVVIEHMVMVPFEWAHNVPIVVEFSMGDDWGNKTDVGNYASDTWAKSLGIDDKRRKELGI